MELQGLDISNWKPDFDPLAVYCDMGIDRILTDNGANLRITIPPRKPITDWAPQFVLRAAYRSGT